MMTATWMPVDPASSTIQALGLLAGAGTQVSAFDDWWRDLARRDGPDLRSCIDADSRLLVSLSVPASGRRLSFYARVPGVARPGVTDWTRLDWDGHLGSGWRTWYSGEPVGTWDDVIAAVGRGFLEHIAGWHRILGAGARVYSISVDRDGRPWVSWQLDPRVQIERALAALDHGGAWLHAADFFGALLGRVPAVAAPWSLAVRSDGLRWRIGTSRWGRLPENDDKRRRCAAVIGALGGDRNFAEASYKLLSAATDWTTVGRAVELEFSGSDSPAGAEFFLAVPGPSTGPDRCTGELHHPLTTTSQPTGD